MRSSAKRSGHRSPEASLSSPPANNKEIRVLDGFKLHETHRLLRAGGNNLNQLTTLANMGRIHTAELSETYETLRKCHLLLDEVRDGVWRG